MHKEIDKNLAKILSSEYEFNSDSYANLINDSINIEQSSNVHYFLNEMSKSNDYAVIFALSFILEHASRDFMKENKNKIADIIIRAIQKGYDRANFYFAESLLYVMDRDIDYILYIELLVKSESVSVQDIALTHIFRLNENDLIKFDILSKDLDFYYMLDDFENYLSMKNKSSISMIQKKIIAMSYHKKHNNKTDAYKLFGENNQYLFDFIYFLPNVD
ncbi:hypothetical protein [Moraxella porci]|uniref:hypothetical protein n=1 Tax=Moraxella porci TaxID=1288392 RepID=UPI00244AE34B|nr:hypothetical protein [Moraxella porci]MDH2274439.1 hypothetical protein [Moraxella porci]